MDINRHIVTVATKECESGLRRVVSCLIKCGWPIKSNPIRVYTPEVSWNPGIAGTLLKRITPWWQDVEALTRCRNSPALAKPSAFLDPEFSDGDLVLYLDSADIMLFRNPDALFDMFYSSGAILGARPFRFVGRQSHEYSFINRLLNDELSDPAASEVNSGVICARVSPMLRMAMAGWKYLLGYCAFAGPWRLHQLPANRKRVFPRLLLHSRRAAGRIRRTFFPPSRPAVAKSKIDIVGDQQAFNLIFRTLRRDSLTFEIPACWHYVGSLKVARHLRVLEGRVIDENGEPVWLAHSSGIYAIPEGLVTFGTGLADETLPKRAAP